MNIKKRLILFAFAAALLISFSFQNSSEHKVLFEKAKFTMETKGDLKGAINLFEEIIKKYPDEREYAAKSQLYIGLCYEKLGLKEAQKAFQKVIDEYPDQAEVVKVANEKLSLILRAESVFEKGDKEFKIRQVWEGFGLASEGAPSPNGRYISDTDWETGDLIVRDLTTKEKRCLTKNSSEWSGFPGHSTFSPDSKQVAYAWFNENLIFDLHITGLDDSRPRILYSSEEVEEIQPAVWSPDGKYIIAVITRKNQIHQIVQVFVKDGSVRILKSLDWRKPGEISLSPDGRYLVYDFPPLEDSQNRDIFLLSIDRNQEIPLVEHAANDFVLGWTPDGKRVLFASNRMGTTDAWTIPVSNGRSQGIPELIKKDIGQVSPMGFTQKGTYYYSIQSMISDVYVAGLDPETGKLLSKPTPISSRFVGNNSAPTWSPDGKFLAYLLDRDSKLLCIRTFESGEERDLSPKLNDYNWPLWSPEGSTILVTGQDEKNRYGLYLIDPQTGKVTPFAQCKPGEYIQQATWSSDGKSIYFRRFYSKENWFMRRDLEKDVEREVLHDASVRDSAVSPDGRSLVFLSLPGSALKIMPVAGGEIRELFRVEGSDYIPGYSRLSWTPDGKYVLFVKAQAESRLSRKTELWRVSIKKGEIQPLGMAMDRLRNISLSPDGRWIAFDAGQIRAEIWVMENFLPEEESLKKSE